MREGVWGEAEARLARSHARVCGELSSGLERLFSCGRLSPRRSSTAKSEVRIFARHTRRNVRGACVGGAARACAEGQRLT